MSWAQWVWPILASASLTLGLIHGLVWLRRREMRRHLAFSVAAISVAALTLMELRAMQTFDAGEFAGILRWMHIPVTTLVVALVAFVRYTFGPRYLSIGFAAAAMRLVALMLNFTTGANLNFEHIDTMGRVQWGDSTWVSYPIGTPNPWVGLAMVSNLLLAAYVVLVMRWALKAGDGRLRRDALVVGTGWLLFIAVMICVAAMMTFNVGRMPFVGTPSFVIVIIAMSFQLGRSLLDADGIARELHDRELDLELAADAAALGLWSWSIADDRFGGSVKARELMGGCGRDCPRDAGLADVMARIVPEDRLGVSKAIDVALQSKVLSASFRLVKSGESVWLSVSGRVEVDTHGNPRVMRGVALDSTESHMANGHIGALLDSAPAALLLIDDAGRVRLLNTEVERMFGYPRDELLGKPLSLLLPEVSLPGASRPTACPRAEARGVRSDATGFPVDVRVKTMTLGPESLELVLMTDLSETRRREVELQERSDEVAHLSRVTMLGQLSGSLAHELNQPLTAILSNAQAAQRMLALSQEHVEEFQEILSDIVASGRRASEVIRRLRAMLRKETGPRARLEVNDIVRDSLRLVRTDLRGRGVIVLTELMPDGVLVEGDFVQLQQVLLNLVLNGCDAMADSHTRRLTIRSAVVDGRARISVLDEGVGIPPGMLARMFLPFETTKAGGMGIGLAVSRTIAEAHDAGLWAENLPDGGAGLHFELRVAESGVKAANAVPTQ